MKRKLLLVPRNPFLVPAIHRKAGAHGKTAKAQRRADKIEVDRRVAQSEEHPAFNRDVESSILSAPTTTLFAWRLKRCPAPEVIQFTRQSPAE